MSKKTLALCNMTEIKNNVTHAINALTISKILVIRARKSCEK